MKCVFPTHFILDANIWGYFMTAAIVDDLIKDIQVLEEYLNNYCQEHKVHIQVHRFTSESAFLQSLDQTEYSLVFLDIYMQNETGIRLAQQVRRTFPRCQVIFTTASKEHALEAFRVRALDYLVKPYTYDELADAMKRFEETAEKFIHYIEVKEGRYQTRILIDDIVYTDYSNHYIQIHTTSCVVRSYMSFADFAPMLESYPQFLWCYRNCLVNMDHIESLEDRDFLMKNRERVPISKARKNEVTQAYADYLFDYVNGGIH